MTNLKFCLVLSNYHIREVLTLFVSKSTEFEGFLVFLKWCLWLVTVKLIELVQYKSSLDLSICLFLQQSIIIQFLPLGVCINTVCINEFGINAFIINAFTINAFTRNAFTINAFTSINAFSLLLIYYERHVWLQQLSWCTFYYLSYISL